MTVGGSALKIATDKVIEKAKGIAAELMEVNAGDVAFKYPGRGGGGTLGRGAAAGAPGGPGGPGGRGLRAALRLTSRNVRVRSPPPS